MNRETLRLLEMLNHISLTEPQKDEIISFFDEREKDLANLDKIDVSNTERMVHVMPIMTVVREDAASQIVSRDALQENAPETDEGYWCVPKVLE